MELKLRGEVELYSPIKNGRGGIYKMREDIEYAEIKK